ncbi:hypothetical protein GCM10020218_102000 [Dactylosporangium vinaceum]
MELRLIDEVVSAIRHGGTVTLILGAGMTMPAVPGLGELVELADRYAAGLGDDGELTQSLRQAREALDPHALPIEVYLAYRRVFTARRSPGEFDVVAQQAVLAGYRAPDLSLSPLATHGIWQRVDLRLGERVENSLDWWELPAGVRAVGRPARRAARGLRQQHPHHQLRPALRGRRPPDRPAGGERPRRPRRPPGPPPRG